MSTKLETDLIEARDDIQELKDAITDFLTADKQWRDNDEPSESKAYRNEVTECKKALAELVHFKA